MIDLHCHSNFSDGEFSPEELLKKAENLKLEYFSITDHNNCFAYENIDETKFSGKLIKGVEIATSFEKYIIEVLGYGVKIEKINKWNKEERKKEPIYAKQVYERLINIFQKNNIYYTANSKTKELFNENCTTGTIKQYIYNDLLKYKQNKLIIEENVLSSYSNFNKNGLNNPNSILFINECTRFLSLNQAVNLIHESGGLCFLAHIYQYDVGNHIKFVTKLLNTVKLDGLETYHSSFSNKQIAQINKFADEKHLYKSGGSDFHGKLKPGITLGLNLQISSNLIKNWIDKIK